jgi:hypothetical protein
MLKDPDHVLCPWAVAAISGHQANALFDERRLATALIPTAATDQMMGLFHMTPSSNIMSMLRQGLHQGSSFSERGRSQVHFSAFPRGTAGT